MSNVTINIFGAGKLETFDVPQTCNLEKLMGYMRIKYGSFSLVSTPKGDWRAHYPSKKWSCNLPCQTNDYKAPWLALRAALDGEKV